MIFENKLKIKKLKTSNNSNYYKWRICPSLPHFNAVVVENSLQCDDNDNLFNAHELDSKHPFFLKNRRQVNTQDETVPTSSINNFNQFI